MKTVIMKWNPSFSSYSMMHYLMDISRSNDDPENDDYDWSVNDYKNIHPGDRYYLVKVGWYGQTGIVARGEITSEPFTGEDWSGQGRRTYYVKMMPELMINPDVLPILSVRDLSASIPDFEWGKGASGLVLTDAQAEKLEALWQMFMVRHKADIDKLDAKQNYDKDLVFVKQ